MALATGRFSVGEDTFGLKAAAEPSQGFPPPERIRKVNSGFISLRRRYVCYTEREVKELDVMKVFISYKRNVEPDEP
jgi:hypothetical protein